MGVWEYAVWLRVRGGVGLWNKQKEMRFVQAVMISSRSRMQAPPKQARPGSLIWSEKPFKLAWVGCGAREKRERGRPHALLPDAKADRAASNGKSELRSSSVVLLERAIVRYSPAPDYKHGPPTHPHQAGQGSKQ